MANVIVRNEPEQSAPLAQIPYEPFGLMRSLLGWDPFREMAPLIQRQRVEFIPDFEVKETADGYLFKADVPGVKSADLEVTISANRLTVSGKRQTEREEKGETYYACERAYGSFSRSFTLPDGANVDEVKADLSDGVLSISIQKKAEIQPKKIEVKSQGAAEKAEKEAH